MKPFKKLLTAALLLALHGTASADPFSGYDYPPGLVGLYKFESQNLTAVLQDATGYNNQAQWAVRGISSGIWGIWGRALDTHVPYEDGFIVPMTISNEFSFGGWSQNNTGMLFAPARLSKTSSLALGLKLENSRVVVTEHSLTNGVQERLSVNFADMPQQSDSSTLPADVRTAQLALAQGGLRNGYAFSKANGHFIYNPNDPANPIYIYDNFVSNSVETPHFYLVTYKAGQIALYIDGILMKTAPISNPAATVVAPNQVGTATGGGFIDEVMFWKDALLPAYVSRLYRFGLPGSKPLVATSIPPVRTGMYGADIMTLRITNTGSKPITPQGRLHNQSGELLWVGNLTSSPIPAGGQVSLTQDNLATLSSATWDGRATLFIEGNTLNETRQLGLTQAMRLNGIPETPAVRMSGGISGDTCYSIPATTSTLDTITIVITNTTGVDMHNIKATLVNSSGAKIFTNKVLVADLPAKARAFLQMSDLTSNGESWTSRANLTFTTDLPGVVIQYVARPYSATGTLTPLMDWSDNNEVR